MIAHGKSRQALGSQFQLAGAVLGALLMLALWALSGNARAAGGGGGGGDAEMAKPASYKAGVSAINAKDYQKAMALFAETVASTPGDADAYNYLGYSYRKMKDYERALLNYQKALQINPRHLGALEYLGEAYLELGDLAKAKQQLAKLDNICLLGCEEYSDLKAQVKEYEDKHK